MNLRTVLMLAGIVLSTLYSAGALAADKGVVEASQEKGFRLSEAALRTLEVKTETVRGTADRFVIPRAALVFYQERVGVYRFHEGWFKLIEVRIIGRSVEKATIQTRDFRSGDHIATQGVPLLRVTQMEIEGGGE